MYLFDNRSDWVLIARFDSALHFFGKSLAICLELWEVIQCDWPFVLGVGDVCVVGEVRVEATDPEVGYSQIVPDKPFTLGAERFDYT